MKADIGERKMIGDSVREAYFLVDNWSVAVPQVRFEPILSNAAELTSGRKHNYTLDNNKLV